MIKVHIYITVKSVYTCMRLNKVLFFNHKYEMTYIYDIYDGQNCVLCTSVLIVDDDSGLTVQFL